MKKLFELKLKIITHIRSAIVFSTLLIIVGCATTATDVKVERIKYELNVSEIVFVDLSSPKNEWESGFLEFGYRAVPDNITNPPFTQYVLNSLRSAFVPVQHKGENTFEITIINAQVLYEFNAVDNIPFVQMATAHSPRKHICRVDISLKLGATSERFKYDAIEVRNGFWRGLKLDEQKSMIESCVKTIVSNVNDSANELINKSKVLSQNRKSK